ncbi:hypothetical protein Asppvi_000021 [Aspergillus pseudoviridinutans]|uniref:Xylanolytic transcriptional activator regulatory domain-containing protein n=1 Tax=Aspergillus pseudoviridinutans TaxID=1517512 RepID=A0A9P3B0Q0_9EURO|nr:uncharacterized protein Asppvi_000021 [Aspergillus pseudoviridinutans]GIJ81522.1 hypothetical protein Asppvi_000021 [Aspergillus pseudoviridinutans]
MRRLKPVLLLTILGVSSGTIVPQLQSILGTEVARQIAERAMFRTEKSLDLIQAMIVYAVWHLKHRETKAPGFSQYIHSAAVMAMEIGLGNRLRASLAKSREEEAEMRRTWLTCYYATISYKYSEEDSLTNHSVSVILHHPPLIRFSPYIDECLKFFSEGPAPAATDLTLCSLIRLTQITEDVSLLFHLDDPTATISIDDPRTQYLLKFLNTRLEEWKVDAAGHMNSDILEHSFKVTRLLTHEVALRYDYNADPSSTARIFTAAHFDALATCVGSISRILDSFIHMDLRMYRVVECPYMTWTLYATIAMIRLSGILRLPAPKLTDMLLPESKLEHYLNTVILKFTSLSQMDANPSAESFLHAFQRLRSWNNQKSTGSSIPLVMNEIRAGICETKSSDKENTETGQSTHAATLLHVSETQSDKFLGSREPLFDPSSLVDDPPFDTESWNATAENLGNLDPFNLGIWFE